jgi:hypothetical protein
VCQEVLGVDKKGNRAGIPEGCAGCQSTIEWDCEHCLWPENHWKYEELQRYIVLHKYASGGMDLNRIDSLRITDFAKIAILKEYL